MGSREVVPQARFKRDTLHSMTHWAVRHYGLSVKIYISMGMDGETYDARCGRMAPIRPGQALIQLNGQRKYNKLIEVLAHELTHVVTFKSNPGYPMHGPKFWKNYVRLIWEWNRHAKKVGDIVLFQKREDVRA